MLFVIGAAVAALLVLILLFRTVWRVAEPNEALIISGLGAHGEASTERQPRLQDRGRPRHRGPARLPDRTAPAARHEVHAA